MAKGARPSFACSHTRCLATIIRIRVAVGAAQHAAFAALHHHAYRRSITPVLQRQMVLLSGKKVTPAALGKL
jgi:hypothetical protein